MELTPQVLLSAYSQGVFPMAQEGEIYWYDPDPRTILPLDQFHISRSLRRTLKRGHFSTTINQAFAAVISACASSGRPGGWIDNTIIQAYLNLHHIGFAHSVETWHDGVLVGGLYGVALRGLFAGESMFSHQSDASKVALVALVERLNARGFLLLDVQFQTSHLAQFGTIEIPRDHYKALLAQAMHVTPRFA